MHVHRGDRATRWFLNGDREPDVGPTRAAPIGVGRKQVEGGAIRQPHREPLVLDEDLEHESASRVTIAAHILLQLVDRDLRLDLDAFARHLERPTCLMHPEPHDHARSVAVERHRDLFRTDDGPAPVAGRRVQLTRSATACRARVVRFARRS
jgi:hypothetical protein